MSSPDTSVFGTDPGRTSQTTSSTASGAESETVPGGTSPEPGSATRGTLPQQRVALLANLPNREAATLAVPVTNGENTLAPPVNRTASRNLFASAARLSDIPTRLGQGAALARTRSDWFLVVFCYLLAWVIPVVWCAPFWFNPTSPVSFQPLVPLGALLLAWSRRVELRHLWAELHMLYSPENSRLRGDMRWAVVGSLLLLVSHFARLPGVAIIGLILVAVGVLRQAFGAMILRELGVPLVFLCLTIPPPETVTTLMQQYMMYGSTKAVAVMLNLLGRPILPGAINLPIEGYPITLDVGTGGAAVVAVSFALSLWLVLMVRANLIGMFATVASAFCAAIVLNLSRLLAMALIGPTNSGLADALGQINPWLLASVAFLIAYLIGRALRFGQKSK